MTFAEYETPCGQLLLGVYSRSICLCDWIREGRIETSLRRLRRQMPSEYCEDDRTLLPKAAIQLDEYFDGRRKSFELPLAVYGTEFQRRVWEALSKVPYGSSVSYSFIAKAISQPSAVRSVASAIGANPLSILIPCHRVIGADGSLTGYAGGLPAKSYLLKLESSPLSEGAD